MDDQQKNSKTVVLVEMQKNLEKVAWVGVVVRKSIAPSSKVEKENSIGC